ncbi:MAG TPA: 50S ribosomal protein L30 [Usitatibacter sp.]|jgi:large subunit ribosomal protein L30|nr:50S ribosomal protein L30 [Usitatibacter sp.]
MNAKAKPAAAGKKIRVTLVKGITSTKYKHRESVKGLGLKHRSHTVEVEDTPAVRGMINRVSYLVKVEE